MHTKIICRAMLGILFAHSVASAAVLTAPAQLSPSNTQITFDSLSSGIQSNPLTIGNATFSSTAQLSLFNVTSSIYTPPAALVSGNVLFSNTPGVFNDWSYVNIRIDFALPISELGLSWWDSNFLANKLDVYNASSVLLESAFIPGVPTGGNYASFAGIKRSSNDIAYAIARWSASNDLGGIDNVSFSTVPEPSTVVLVLGASLCLWCRQRTFRKHHDT